MKMFAYNLLAMIILMKENPSLTDILKEKGYGSINLSDLQVMVSTGNRINSKLNIAIRTIYTSIKNGDDTRLQTAYNKFAEDVMGQDAMKEKIFSKISETQDCADVSAESDELSLIIQEAVNKGFGGEPVNLNDMADHLEYNISMLIRAKNAIVYMGSMSEDEDC